MRVYYIYVTLLVVLSSSVNAFAGCDGTTTALGTDCVHFQTTASNSYQGLLTTRARACERNHEYLDNRLKTWAENNCINKAWRPDRDAGSRSCRNLEYLAVATRGVRCLQGVNLAITDSFNAASCQRSTNQYTAIKKNDGTIQMILNYSTQFPRPAEMLSPCTGDVFTAIQRCHFALRDFYLPQTDCVCKNRVCELKERLNLESPSTAGEEVPPPAEINQ
jgi:hypothetical protein